jgi:nicotinamidase-related amidase
MLDPATVQILFADLQPPIVARSKTNPPQSLSRAATVLAQCARLLGLPVHHSVVPEGGKTPEVLPDLAKETEGAPQFARMTVDAFLDPQTREAIDAIKRPVLVIAGFATEAVVLNTALSALESDYQVQVVSSTSTAKPSMALPTSTSVSLRVSTEWFRKSRCCPAT